MDGISSISSSSYLSQVPVTSTTDQTSATATPAPSDSVTLSGGDAEATMPNTYAPDAGFTTLLQSDSSLAQDFAAENQFGFDDSVLANDDTLSSDQTNSTSGTSNATAQTAQSSDPATLSAQVDLGALNFNSGVMSALLGGLSDSSSALFMGSSMNSLLSSNGSAALAYLTPAAAQASGSIDVSL